MFKAKYYTIGAKSSVQYPDKILNPHKDAGRIVIGESSILKCEIQLLGHGGRVLIGDYCHVGENSYLWSGMSIRIGNRVLIGHGCNVFDNDIHPMGAGLRHKQYVEIITIGQPKKITLNDSEVVIEDDVWIGANVTVLKGVRIGEGAIIGANSVVTKNIEPYTVNAGNPTRVLKKVSEN